MRERLPDWLPELRMFPRPEPVIVRDDNNTVVVARYLADVDYRRRNRPGWKRIVIRPTPGAGDRASLGLDVMAALGKNPDLLRQDKLGPDTWDLAAAWLIEAAVTDVFLVRAHTLPIERIQELLDLNIALKASLWLIWGGHEPTAPVEALIREAGFRGRVDWFRPQGDSTIATDELQGALPLPGGTADDDRDRILTRPARPWPVLPAVDFPTFRAACRRHLSPSDFARADTAYLQAADRVDTWISDRIRTLIEHQTIPTDTELADQAVARAQQLVHRQAQLEGQIAPDASPAVPPVPPAIGTPERAGRSGPIQLRDLGAGELTAWLRDTQLGPAAADGLALITLRATQAALLRHAVLLAWDPGSLGSDPNARLRGDVTRLRSNALYALGRTEHAAATALSLHLNHPPTFFGCWRLDDVAPDGSLLLGGPHHHPLGRWSGAARVNDPCATTIQVPKHARRLLVAHRMYRRIQGAGDDDPFFINTRDAGRSPATTLRARAGNTCQRLNLNASWLHVNCRSRDATGLVPRSYGWLQERGLSLHQLTPGIPDSPHRLWPASTVPAGP